MSLIESTTQSQLGADAPPGKMPAVDMDAFDVLASDEHDEAVVERTPVERPSAGTRKEMLIAQIDDINLARYMTDEDLRTLGSEVVEGYRIDEISRSPWEMDAKEAMAMAMQREVAKNYPWPNASNFIWPLITQATLEFASRTYPAIVPGKSIVKGNIWGSDTGTPVTVDGEPDGQPRTGPDGEPLWLIPPGGKRLIADRIADHMSYQLLEEMPEWEPQTDAMLHQMPVVGGFARKTMRNPVEGCNSSLAVSLFNLVWNYNAPCFETAPRITEKVLLYPSEIVDLERFEDTGEDTGEDSADDSTEDAGGGMFLPLNYGPGGGEGETFNGQDMVENHTDGSAPQIFIEQHCRIDLDGDGYPEPYIVTVHLRSQRVVRIVARYLEAGIVASDDGNTIHRIEPTDLYTLYRFVPSIDGGSYPMGFGHLLRAMNVGINTSINQMFDAGTLANTGGGFISESISLPSGQTLFGTGKFHRVVAKGVAIRDAVYPIDFKGPNPVLFQLLGTLIGAAEKIAGTASILTGDASIANAPPTTVLALIEQGLNFYNGIVKRIFLSEKQELEKLHALNRRYITSKTEYTYGDEVKFVQPDDYRRSAGVVPITDPTQTTDMQKLGRGQVLMSVRDEPGINRLAVVRRFLEAANIDRVDDLISGLDPQAAAGAQAAQQLQMSMAQAQIGELRAKELKEQTQAFLNMALARKNASASEEAFIERQLEFMRLKIESINAETNSTVATVRAHEASARAHGQSADREAAAEEAARNRDHQRRESALDRAHAHDLARLKSPSSSPSAPASSSPSAPSPSPPPPPPVMPTPGPTGDFPVPPEAPAGPDVVGPGSFDTGTTAVPGMGPPGPGNPEPGAGQ